MTRPPQQQRTNTLKPDDPGASARNPLLPGPYIMQSLPPYFAQAMFQFQGLSQPPPPKGQGGPLCACTQAQAHRQSV